MEPLTPFKAKVAVDAFRGEKTLVELSKLHDMQANRIVDWTNKLLDLGQRVRCRVGIGATGYFEGVARKGLMTRLRERFFGRRAKWTSRPLLSNGQGRLVESTAIESIAPMHCRSPRRPSRWASVEATCTTWRAVHQRPASG